MISLQYGSCIDGGHPFTSVCPPFCDFADFCKNPYPEMYKTFLK